MMRYEEFLVGYAACVWSLVALLLVAEAVVWMKRRLHARERRWLGCAVRQVWELLTTYDTSEASPGELGRLVRKEALAELLSRVTSAGYGLYYSRMRNLVEQCDVDVWLLLRARRSRGYRRAYYLKRLSEVPHRRACTQLAERYLHDGCREVRFCALLVQLAADPEHLLHRMMAYEEPFTETETAEVLHLLRCGVLPIAYRPLLESPSENLCRVGLALVAQFEITEAEPLVRQVVMRGDDALAHRAIYVLAGLHRSLARRGVRERVVAMSPIERRRLLRYLAAEAYTPAQVRRFCRVEEVAYYERLSGSYKSLLVGR